MTSSSSAPGSPESAPATAPRQADPSTRYVILERRERIGGTWDLFRLSPVCGRTPRSSPSAGAGPWTPEGYVADGDEIRDYWRTRPEKHGIYPHRAFAPGGLGRLGFDDRHLDHPRRRGRHAQEDLPQPASSSSAPAITDYDEPYTPTSRHRQFGGRHGDPSAVLARRTWTAAARGSSSSDQAPPPVPLVPALARKGRQRSSCCNAHPDTYVSMNRRNRVIRTASKLLAARFPTLRQDRGAGRGKGVLGGRAGAPNLVKKVVRSPGHQQAARGLSHRRRLQTSATTRGTNACAWLPTVTSSTDQPGHQLEVVTDHIDHVDATGIVLTSGRHLDADIIVTATGLNLLALGGCGSAPTAPRPTPGPVLLQSPHARGRTQPDLVHRLHQCLVDPARRHHGPRDGKLMAP